eukprot:TRINITY_DN58347_c0_g1_i1.p1 TRINITY_DN58347_c0_g1~~TRINITY_DN58347_c0_g1_i1.p1  ORF type:complete len:338 (+),score=62.87 TRINITY_DN58347_c0_g1_i1:181-1194(+)
MDEARKLLDSLMGQTRDASLEEAKKNKGQNFKQESVCKHFLLGFCPLDELAASKMLGKRNINECRRTHSDAMKVEFEGSKDFEKCKMEYERALLPVLEGLVREADAWVARERANVQRTELTTPEKTTVNNMPPTVKEQHEQLTEDMNKLMAAAEDIAEKGDVDGSKFKVMLAGEIKSKIKEIEDKYIVTYNITHRGEEVCEICGTRTEAATAANHARYAAHFSGKVHLAYVKIREWIKTLRSKIREHDERSAGTTDRRRRSSPDRRDGTRDTDVGGDRAPRRRSRSRGGADRERERRGGSRERRQSRSRGRGGGDRRGGDDRNGGDRRRDRSRSRRR